MPEGRIVVVGCGFGGGFAAKALGQALPSTWEVVAFDRWDFTLFTPLLVEATVGILEARHATIPIHRLLGKRARFIMAEVVGVDTSKQTVEYKLDESLPNRTLEYDYLLLALGSVTKPPQAPGFTEFGFQFKSLAEGIELRDRAIRLLELADVVDDEALRREILRVVVVGGNYTGVEFAGEYQAFMARASKDFPRVSESEIEVILLEYGPKILASMDDKLSNYVHASLERRGLRVLTGTTVTEVGPTAATLTTGEILSTRTVVWTAGIAPNPLISTVGLPVNDRGYITCDPTMKVQGRQKIYALGDCASVPDENGKPYAATAQFAMRQGAQIAKNVVRDIENLPLEPFRFKSLGSFAAFGRQKAAAEVKGLRLKGFLGWIVYRTAYLVRMPSISLKVRLGIDWFLDFFLPFPPVQLGLHRGNRLKK